MKGVAQNNLRAHLVQVARHHALYGAVGAYRHKDGCLHQSVVERERASAGVAAWVSAFIGLLGGVGGEDVKFQHEREVAQFGLAYSGVV